MSTEQEKTSKVDVSNLFHVQPGKFVNTACLLINPIIADNCNDPCLD